jgi:Rieske Fe-S protein
MTTARDVEPALPNSAAEPRNAPVDMPVTTDETQDGQLSRRRLMRNVAIAGGVVAAGAGLAACGGSGGSSGSGNPPSTPTVLGKTSDIPVGGGTIYASQHVVVTQPSAGTFKCFSSTCTHMGCTVDKVADGLIQCPCHGSRYSVTDGSVKGGPAPKPLPPEQIAVKNGQVVLNG